MFKKILLTGLLIASFTSVYAAAPTLSLSNSGSGDGVLVSVTGDPNSSISLSYYSTVTSGLQTQNIGNTSSTGTFWTVLSTAAYNVSSNGSVYVTVNGQQSTSMVWPYSSGGTTSGAFSLNQTGLVLSPGQTSTLTATNGTSMYLFNNTNPSVVNVSIIGSQVNVSANSSGSTVFTVCSGSSSNCVSVYVTVQNGNAQLLTFSQSNVTIGTGQSLPISVYGGSGAYTIVSNSNTGVVQTSLIGSTINLYGSSGSGQSSVTVCTTDMSSCGIINVTIGTTNSSSVSFTQTNPMLSTGQSLSIPISGSSGIYSISSNSNPSSVQASILGTSLNLYGAGSGTSNVTVCSSTGSCGTLTITVSTGGGGGSITLSQTSLVLVVGQTVGITVSGGSIPYSILNPLGNVVQSSLIGNIVNLTGTAVGSSTINVCSSGGGCVALIVVVNGGSGGSGTTATPGFSQSNVSLTIGQNTTVSIMGSGGYYLSNNTNPSVAGAIINGSSMVITANANGATSLTVCQSTSQCNTIPVVVGGNTTIPPSSVPVLNPVIQVGKKINFTLSGGTSYYLSSPQNTAFTARITGNTLAISGDAIGSGQVNVCLASNACTTFTVTVTTTPNEGSVEKIKHKFNTALSFGAKGDEVIELQKRLHDEGYFNGAYVAKYGEATMLAVKKYQKDNGLSPIGNLGPATRALLNK